MSAIIIGPWAAGKTTSGPVIAEALNTDFTDLDNRTQLYGAELGWSIEQLIYRNSEVGMQASESEWEEIRAHCVSRILEDFPNSVISFGASFTDYTDPQFEDSVRRTLLNDPRPVILLLPLLCRQKSIAVSQERAAQRGVDWVEDRKGFASWYASRMAFEVADFVVTTHNVEVKNIAKQVADFVRSRTN